MVNDHLAFKRHMVFRSLNLLVPTRRQTLGSHRATGGALPTLNSDCEADRGRRVKRYKPD